MPPPQRSFAKTSGCSGELFPRAVPAASGAAEPAYEAATSGCAGDDCGELGESMPDVTVG